MPVVKWKCSFIIPRSVLSCLAIHIAELNAKHNNAYYIERNKATDIQLISF